MGSSARGNGRKVKPHYHTRHRVGEFFEQNAHCLLGGILSSNDGVQQEDLRIPELDLGIEVKAGSSDQPMKIPIEQKNHYEEMLFLDRFAYLLCCYKNRDRVTEDKGFKRLNGTKGKAVSVLARFTRRSDQNLILSKKIFNHYLFDIEVMNALEKEIGATPGSQPARYEQSQLELRRKDLYRFNSEKFLQTLRALRMNPRKWVLGEYEMAYMLPITDPDYLGFGGERSITLYPVRYNFVTVLHKDFHLTFSEYFKGLQKERLSIPKPETPSL